eukprot:7529013-Pyramimonas_sp.AAC.1
MMISSGAHRLAVGERSRQSGSAFAYAPTAGEPHAREVLQSFFEIQPVKLSGRSQSTQDLVPNHASASARPHARAPSPPCPRGQAPALNIACNYTQRGPPG